MSTNRWPMDIHLDVYIKVPIAWQSPVFPLWPWMKHLHACPNSCCPHGPFACSHWLRITLIFCFDTLGHKIKLVRHHIHILRVLSFHYGLIVLYLGTDRVIIPLLSTTCVGTKINLRANCNSTSTKQAPASHKAGRPANQKPSLV
jgi:hypothetical protein